MLTRNDHESHASHVKDFVDFVDSLVDDAAVKNSQIVVGGGSVDLFFPERNVAFKLRSMEQQLIDENRYAWLAHKDAGIDLIQIWVDEWVYRRETVERIIRLRLDCDEPLLPDTCNIRIIGDSSVKKRFFDSYHLLGDSDSMICLGAYQEDNIVCAASFVFCGRWVMSRFAFSARMTNGLSAILNHFSDIYPDVSVTVFDDLCCSDAELYRDAGMMLYGFVAPSRFFVSDGCRTFFDSHDDIKECSDGLWDAGKLVFKLV